MIRRELHPTGLRLVTEAMPHVRSVYTPKGELKMRHMTNNDILQMENWRAAAMETVIDRLGKLPLHAHPGEVYQYGYSTDVLGRLVEVVSGKSLYQFQKENILDPLGMTDTSYYVADATKHARIAEPFKDDRKIGIGAEFGDRLPVVLLDGAEHSYWEIDEPRLRADLRKLPPK